jgi:hypothetical protein
MAKILRKIDSIGRAKFIQDADLLNLRGDLVFLACSSYDRAARG